MNSNNVRGTTLKGKCHIIQRKYKVNGFMKTINHKLQVEVGAGNNQYNTNVDDETTYIKLSNRGDLDIKIRLAKDGKEARFIPLSPADEYNGISIFFTGRDAAAYLREAHEYIGYMINGFYELPRLKNPDYTNDEERFIDEDTDLLHQEVKM
jgi:hypothetical protein